MVLFHSSGILPWKSLKPRSQHSLLPCMLLVLYHFHDKKWQVVKAGDLGIPLLQETTTVSMSTPPADVIRYVTASKRHASSQISPNGRRRNWWTSRWTGVWNEDPCGQDQWRQCGSHRLEASLSQTAPDKPWAGGWPIFIIYIDIYLKSLLYIFW